MSSPLHFYILPSSMRWNLHFGVFHSSFKDRPMADKKKHRELLRTHQEQMHSFYQRYLELVQIPG